MMTNKNKQSSTRIPVRFVDEETKAAAAASTAAATTAAATDDSPNTSDTEPDDKTPSAEEIGEASSYEDATEVQRRIDRGAEADHSTGRAEADDRDVAGSPPSGETPEQREDLRNRRGSNESPNNSADSSANNSNGEADDNGDASAPPIVMDAAGPTLAELVATRSELKRVEAARVDLLDKLARRQADFDNYRKRVERERGAAYDRVVADVVGKLLPVVDNLRRALDAETQLEASESKEFRHFLHGVELISKQLDGVLEGLGLQSVAAVGETFDPHVHEAVATEQTEDYEPDTVMQELVRGYRLGEKLLRPAIVKVATR